VKSLQKPTPLIWIGANGDVANRRAARIGDCWYINPRVTLVTIELQMDLHKRAPEDFKVIILGWSDCSKVSVSPAGQTGLAGEQRQWYSEKGQRP
jgi:hypothetical protein